MDIKRYYEKIFSQAQQVLENALKHQEFAEANSFVEDIVEWRHTLEQKEESLILENVASELNFALFCLGCGLYRQSFMSLRRVLESSCAMVFFSAHKVDFQEWKEGSRDIYWSQLSNEQEGIFSERWVNAFFPELKSHRSMYKNKSTEAYRKLSEYIHGNPKTWFYKAPNISYDKEEFNYWISIFKDIKESIIFILCTRFLKSLNHEQVYKLKDSINENIGHLKEIRKLLGLPLEDINYA